jgi:hypothetical protein
MAAFVIGSLAAGAVRGGERPENIADQAAPETTPADSPASGVAPGDPTAMSGTSPVFTITPAVAKPYMTYTFRYHFPTFAKPADGPFFMHCSREDQPDNEAGLLGYKDLSGEWNNGWITGVYSTVVPWDPSLYGTYSFRIFGPVVVRGEKGSVPGSQRFDHVEQQKLRTEGRFVVGPYEPALTLPSETPPRRRITVAWQGASIHPAAWIGLYKRTSNDMDPIIVKGLGNTGGSIEVDGHQGAWELEAPAELGDYDVRMFIDTGTERVALRAFAVTWGTIHPAVSGTPARCYPMVTMPVSYANAPPENNAWIGVFDATNPSATNRWGWRSLQGRTSGDLTFTAPEYEGSYEVRMYDSADNLLARSPAIEVVRASETIALDASVSSGRVVLTWNNPADYQRLSGYYLYRGTEPGAQSPTPITTAPVPVDRSAAASTQANTYIDSGLSAAVTYYYVLKPVSYDLKTFGAPSNEVSATIPGAGAADTTGGGGAGTAPSSTGISSGSSIAGSGGTPARDTRPPVVGDGVRPRPVVSGPPPVGPSGPMSGGAVPPVAGAATTAPTTGVGAAVAGEVPGAWAEIGRTYRLGETDPIQLALQSAEYEAKRLQFGSTVIWPKAGEKFLVVRFQLSNARRQAMRVVAARLVWSVAPASGAAVIRCEYLGRENGGASFDHTLEAGQASACLAVFRVSGAGEMQSLTVTNRPDAAAATARYDLRGRVRGLPAHLADARDAAGATVVDAVRARLGESFASGVTDVVVQGVEVVGADAPAPTGRTTNLPVYATVRYTFQGPFTPVVFGGRAPVATLIDSQGGSRPAENQTFALQAPDVLPLRPKAGDTVEFRLRFWIPRGTTPQRLVFRDPGGLPVHLDLTTR